MHDPLRLDFSRRRFLAAAAGAGGGLLLSHSALAAYEHYPTIADSVRDFSGAQGYDGWYYGHTPAPYAVESFDELAGFTDGVWLTNAELPRLTAEGGLAGASAERCAVRRWISPVDDKVQISGGVALTHPDDNTDGLRASVYADGRLLWTQHVDREWPTAEFTIQLRLAAGMLVDFVVEPGASTAGDGFRFTAIVGLGGCNNCCFAEPPTRYRQTQLPWGPMLYDHKTLTDPDRTIGDVGCALTCLSMSLAYAGLPNTPGSLNTLLVNGGGYDRKSRGVRFPEAVRAARAVSGKQLVWVWRESSSLADLKAVLCAGGDPVPGVFNAGFPIIVGVQRQPKPGQAFVADHYVLVRGWSTNPFFGDFYHVIDPGFPGVSLLSQYGNRFFGRGYVIDPPGEVSALNVDVDDAALFVTDSLGRTTGFDPATGSVVNIPQSAACGDSLSGDLSAAPAPNFASSVYMDDPPAGSFAIAVTAVTTGVHTLSIRGFSNDGTPQPEVLVPVEAAAGETVVVDVEYSPEPGSVPQLAKSVIVEVAQKKIHLGSHGVIAVAILSTDTFDATTIDPLSVRFGPGEASEAHGKGHVEDWNGDGVPDLVLHFRVDESGLAAGATEVCVAGRTFGGTKLRGCATIEVQ